MSKEIFDKLDTIKSTVEEQISKVEKAAKDNAEGAVEELKKELNAKLEEHNELVDKLHGKDKARDEELKQLKAGIEKLKEENDPSLANKSFASMLERDLKNSEVYKSIVSGTHTKGEIVVKAVGDMTSSSALTGAVIDQPRVAGIFDPILRQTHIRDLFAIGSMTGSQIEYDVEVGTEGGPATTAEGAAKPQVDYDIEHKSDKAIKLPVFARVTDELFADLPAFRSYITGRMIGDVRRLEDTKLIYGAGGADMEGLTVRTGVVNIEANPFSGTIATASTAQAMLAAFATMAAGNVQVNGAVMNPADKYEMMALLSGGGADVAYNLVFEGDIARLNGVPIITSTAVTAGDLIVGDWSASNAQIFQREGIRVSFSTEDATNFTDNKITVLVEERLALAVFRPAAYGYGQIADIKQALTT